MPSVSRLDNANWVVRDDKFYLVSATGCHPTLTHVTIGELLPDKKAKTFLVVGSEIWSGSVHATSTTKLLRQIVEAFVKCRELGSPVELVYDWGGTVCHRSINTTSLHRGLLQ